MMNRNPFGYGSSLSTSSHVAAAAAGGSGPVMNSPLDIMEIKGKPHPATAASAASPPLSPRSSTRVTFGGVSYNGGGQNLNSSSIFRRSNSGNNNNSNIASSYYQDEEERYGSNSSNNNSNAAVARLSFSPPSSSSTSGIDTNNNNNTNISTIRPAVIGDVRPIANRSRAKVGIGLIGAGRAVKARHIPGFKSIHGVDLVAISNRSRASAEAVARDHGIRKTYDTWQELLRDPAVDAVCVGTWPHLHAAIATEAMNQNKHVLIVGRLASSVAEAREIISVMHKKPSLVAMAVPAALTFRVDNVIKELLDSGFVGQPLAVEARFTSNAFAETPSEYPQFQPQHDRSKMGVNAMNLGVWYEQLMRWMGPATRVMASTKVFVRQRRDVTGTMHSIEVPDHIDVIGELANGATLRLMCSNVAGLSPHSEVMIFGTDGSLHLDADTLQLSGGRKGQRSMEIIPIPPGKEHHWRVEDEFIAAIRGEGRVRLTDVQTAAACVEFCEAVMKSARSGSAVHLPLM